MGLLHSLTLNGELAALKLCLESGMNPLNVNQDGVTPRQLLKIMLTLNQSQSAPSVFKKAFNFSKEKDFFILLEKYELKHGLEKASSKISIKRI